MRIVLVGPNQEENLSLRYLASSLSAAGHAVELAPFNSADDTEGVLDLARGCDMVGLSLAFQARAKEFLSLAERLKAQGAPLLVAGGHWASCAAEELLQRHPALDVVVVHEGEQSIVELASAAFSLEKIPGIVFRRGGAIERTPPRPILADLDRLPFPDRRGVVSLFAGVPTATMLGSRGCVSQCDYCCIMTLHRMAPGPRLRRRDPGRIAEEMAQLYHERGIRQFCFHDDNFLVPSVRTNLERLQALERAWTRRGVRDIGLAIKCRPADASPEVLDRLKELGLVRVFLGVESASAQGLASIGRKQQVAHAERALELCLDRAISTQYTLMCFHPETTLATLHSDLAFLRRWDRGALNFCRAEIYTGTPLERRMIEQGRAKGDYLARTYTIADPAAGLASQLAMRIFRARCWKLGGLMEKAIGLDHLAAVLARFYSGRRARKIEAEVHAWCLASNRELIELLSSLVDICAGANGPSDRALRTATEELTAREESARAARERGAERLRKAIDTFAAEEVGQASALSRRLGSKPMTRKLARHAAAVALAVATAGGVACTGGSNEYAAVPLDGGSDQGGLDAGTDAGSEPDANEHKD